MYSKKVGVCLPGRGGGGGGAGAPLLTPTPQLQSLHHKVKLTWELTPKLNSYIIPCFQFAKPASILNYVLKFSLMRIEVKCIM